MAKKKETKTGSALDELVKAHSSDSLADDKKSGKVKQVMDSLDDGQEAIDGSADDAGSSETVFTKAQLAAIERPSGEAYRPRPMQSTGKTDVDVLRACRKSSLPVLLEGFPGCGKTAMIEAAFGDQMLTLEGHGDMEVSDLMGSWQPNPDPVEPYLWQDGPLVKAMQEGLVLFVDDITLVPAQVLARLYPAMDGRKTVRLAEHKGQSVKAEEGFFVVGAHNPGAPGAILSEALQSRFLVQFEVESDLSLALELGVDRSVVRAARNMRKRRREGSVTWAPEMRELLASQRVCSTLGKRAAAENLVAIAPPEAREALVEALGNSFPGVEAMRLGEA